MSRSPCCGVPWIDDGGPRYCAACGAALPADREMRPVPHVGDGTIRRIASGRYVLVAPDGTECSIGSQVPEPQEVTNE